MKSAAEIVAPRTLPEPLREIAHLKSDGTLLVLNGKERDIQVLSFQSLQQRRGHPIKIMGGTVAELAAARAADSEDHTHASVQIETAVNWFKRAVTRSASDMHLRVFAQHADILFRVHGELVLEQHESADYAEKLATAMYNAMADVADPNFRPTEPQDGRIADRKHLPEELHSIRIGTSPIEGYFLMVLRFLYRATRTASLQELGYAPVHIETVEAMRRAATGINIVSGPTGSGKSTTLKTVLEALHAEYPGFNILTVEDPPEYPISGAVQIPVVNARGSGGRSEAFAGAIRAAMRLDPDVIMVGEIRDHESAWTAVRAAQTGHRVWTTLHANSAFSLINRMGSTLAGPSTPLAMVMDLLLDSTVLSGLISQRLVQTLCPYCKRPLREALSDRRRVPAHILHQLAEVMPVDEGLIFVRGDGCQKCVKGIAGRTVVAETVRVTSELLDVVRREGVEQARAHWLRNAGWTPLQHALSKVRAGIVDPTMAEAVVGPLNVEGHYKEEPRIGLHSTDVREASGAGH